MIYAFLILFIFTVYYLSKTYKSSEEKRKFLDRIREIEEVREERHEQIKEAIKRRRKILDCPDYVGLSAEDMQELDEIHGFLEEMGAHTHP